MSDETKRDEDNADYFKSGWDAALKEAKYQYHAGTLSDFLIEQKVPHVPLPNPLPQHLRSYERSNN